MPTTTPITAARRLRSLLSLLLLPAVVLSLFAPAAPVARAQASEPQAAALPERYDLIELPADLGAYALNDDNVVVTGTRRLIETLAAEHDNLRAALDEVCQAGRIAEGVKLCASLRQYWFFHGYLVEGIGWAEQLLARLPAGDPGRGHVLNVLAHLLRHSGDAERAHRLGAEAVALFRNADEPEGLAVALYNQGHSAVEWREFALAGAALEESQQIHRRLGNFHRVATLYVSQANVALGQGDFDEAERRFALADETGRVHGNSYISAAARWSTGLIRTLRGDRDALPLVREGLLTYREYGFMLGIIQSLEALAAQAGLRGRHELGGLLPGAAMALREARQLPLTADQRQLAEPLEAYARGSLSNDEWASALAAGRQLGEGNAVALALVEPSSRSI